MYNHLGLFHYPKIS